MSVGAARAKAVSEPGGAASGWTRPAGEQGEADRHQGDEDGACRKTEAVLLAEHGHPQRPGCEAGTHGGGEHRGDPTAQMVGASGVQPSLSKNEDRIDSEAEGKAQRKPGGDRGQEPEPHDDRR
jgi:hypothetical protein